MERFLGSFTRRLTQVFEYRLIFAKSFISQIVVNSLRFMETNLSRESVFFFLTQAKIFRPLHLGTCS